MAIKIKKSHEGLLHKDLHKKGPLSLELLHKKLAAAKRSGNTKEERRLVFAINAHSFHHGK
jgi:hypothetical protein